MGLKKTVKRIGKALPVIIAYAPVVADAVRQVKEALKTPKPAQPAADGPPPGAPALPAASAE
jgi:hypothetical protein